MKLSIPDELVICGVGNVVTQFYKRIKERCKKVILAHDSKVGTTIEGVQVIDLKEVNYKEKLPMVIALPDDFDRMSQQIRKYDEDAVIIPLRDILNGKI